MTTVAAAVKTVPDAAKTAPAVTKTAPAVTKIAPVTKPERIQDMPPDWLPHIDEEFSSLAEQQGAGAMRDAFATLFDDDGDEDDAKPDIVIIRQAFRKYDSDDSGSIEKGELRSLLADTLKLSLEQVDGYASQLLQRLDEKDGTTDGKIEWRIFRKFYKASLATEEAREQLAAKVLAKAAGLDSTKQRALELFARADKDGSGTLSADELSVLLRETLGSLADAITDAAEWDSFVKDAMARGDKNSDGAWDASEFSNYFGKCLAHPTLISAYTKKVLARGL